MTWGELYGNRRMGLVWWVKYVTNWRHYRTAVNVMLDMIKEQAGR